MKDEFSRRNFVALASAGAVLSACNEVSSGEKNKSAQVDFDTILSAKTISDSSFEPKMLGEPLSSLTSKNPNVGPPTNWAKFDPEYLHIIHIESPSPWKFRVNQAHFPKRTATDNTKRLKRCVAILAEKISRQISDQETRFPSNKEENRPHVRRRNEPKGTPVDETDVKNFIYGSQSQIFLFIQGGLLTFNPSKLISFSASRTDGKLGEDNHAFFNATLLDRESDIGELAKMGRIIRLDNYFTGADGKKLPDDQNVLYAMNFHYGQPTIGGDPIQMILDPDTGNGSGNEP